MKPTGIVKILAVAFCTALQLCMCGQAENPKLKITHLTDNFYVFTTYNTYKNKTMSANGLYITTVKGVVMIDTPWDSTQFQPLIDSIYWRHRMRVVLCIATHSHSDRTGGLEFLRKKGANTYTSKQTDSISKISKEKRSEFVFTKDTVYKIGPLQFETFYPGPAHTPDNIVVWFPITKVLYGGCLVKSTEAADLGYIGQSDLTAWPNTLNRIRKKYPNPKFIITGHQDWTGLKSIEHTLGLLKQGK